MVLDLVLNIIRRRQILSGFFPDKEKSLAPTFYTESPDIDFYIYNRIGDGKEEVLKSCGTPCTYLGALWLNNEQFIFIQSVDDFDSCEENEEGITHCKHIFSISFYDLEENMETIYNSIGLENLEGYQTDDWKRRRFEIYKEWNGDCDYLKK